MFPFSGWIAAIGRRLARADSDAAALLHQAKRLHGEGRFAQAGEWYARFLEREPAHEDALYNAGLACCGAADWTNAAAFFERLVAVAPDLPRAHAELANAYWHCQRPAQALRALGRAIELQPDERDTRLRAAGLCFDLQSDDECEAHAAHALLIDPASATACLLLGNVALRRARNDLAIPHLRRALALDPALDAARDALVSASAAVCDWRDRDELALRVRTLLVDPQATRDQLLLAVNAAPGCGIEESAREGGAQRLAGIYFDGGRTLRTALRRHAARAHGERLRIGYVSPDFGDHPVAHVSSRMYRLHERSRFEVRCYSLRDRSGDAGPYRREIVDGCDGFVELAGMPLDRAAQRIADDGIDILVNLAGYTQDGMPELFALRAAPLQAFWFGYLGGLGGRIADYLIADESVLPPAAAPRFGESIAWLPACYHPAQSHPLDPVPAVRAAYGLPEQGVVLCAFNNPAKIDPAVFESWMRILAQVDDGVLWLSGSAHNQQRPNLEREAAARGVDPRRLVFASRVADKGTHLARTALADLYLDSFRINATSTALDMLIAGVPVLTLEGDSFFSRAGASMLRAFDMPESVCASRDDYEQRAVALARDPAARAALREKIRCNAGVAPLFDIAAKVRGLEAAYRGMWQRHAAGLPPASFRA